MPIRVLTGKQLADPRSIFCGFLSALRTVELTETSLRRLKLLLQGMIDYGPLNNY